MLEYVPACRPASLLACSTDWGTGLGCVSVDIDFAISHLSRFQCYSRVPASEPASKGVCLVNQPGLRPFAPMSRIVRLRPLSDLLLAELLLFICRRRLAEHSDDRLPATEFIFDG